MQLKDMLKIYPEIPQRIVKYNAELNEIVQAKLHTQDTLQAQVLSDMPRGTNISDSVLQAVIVTYDNLDSHAKHLANTINHYISIKQALDEAFTQLTREEMQVIELRYFDRWDWARIPRQMHYDKRQCYNIRDSALAKMSQHNKLSALLD